MGAQRPRGHKAYRQMRGPRGGGRNGEEKEKISNMLEALSVITRRAKARAVVRRCPGAAASNARLEAGARAIGEGQPVAWGVGGADGRRSANLPH